MIPRGGPLAFGRETLGDMPSSVPSWKDASLAFFLDLPKGIRNVANTKQVSTRIPSTSPNKHRGVGL